MYLKRLFEHGIAGADEWRDLWNREILPHLRSLRPVAGPGVRIEQKAGGTVIAAAPVTGTGAARPAAERELYDSYFKLKLAASAGSGGATTHTVTVADGATGGDSLAVVNGYRSYRLEPYAETVSGDRLFFLKYTPAVYGSGGAVVSSATMEIGSQAVSGGGMELPQGDGACYVQLGRVLWSAGAPRVVQDFTGGVADVRWYVSCH